MTLAMAIAISAVVSLTLTPMICAHYMRSDTSTPPKGRIIGRLDRMLERAFVVTQRFYAVTLGWALEHRVFMLLVTVATVVLTVRLYTVLPKGFLPLQDTGILIGSTLASPDVSFQAMEDRQRAAVDVILADPAVASVGSTVGVSSGWSSINRGNLTVSLKPLSERGISSEAVIARLRGPLEKVAGVQTTLFSAQDLRGGGRQGGAQFQYALITQDINELRRWTLALEDKLRTTPGIVDVTSDQDRAGPQVDVVIDRDAAARLGVNTTAIDNALNNAYSQRQISTIYAERNQYKVVLEIDPKLQTDPSLLDRSMSARQAASRCRSRRWRISSAIRRLWPCATRVSSPPPPSASTWHPAWRSVTPRRRVQNATRELRMPEDVRTEFAGNARFLQQSLATQPLLIAAALISIYIVLGVLYESLLHPLTIISTLPSAGIGALLALLITGNELSIMGLIGIILLMGIVKKNAIMLVDFALEAERQRGLSPELAIREACLERFRPIMMTTLAALLGAVPLALAFGTGAELRRPLGISIIGGLIVSQMLTLYTTPVVYLALERLAGKRPPIVVPAE